MSADRYLPLEPDYLRYPWVADLARMRDELGFAPRFSAEETLHEFAEVQRRGRMGPARVGLARDEERLQATIEQRRRPPQQPVRRRETMTSTEMPAQAAETQEPLADAETRRQLVAELDALIRRTRALLPGYEPPPFSPRRFVALLEERLRDLPLDVQLPLLEQLRGILSQDLLDVEVWKGMWYMLNYTAQYNVDLVKRRFSGEYDTDEWGTRPGNSWTCCAPFSPFLYKIYWRVQAFGLDNIPVEGRALLVANRSGPLPWDSLMLTTAVMTEHPAQRLVRTLHGRVAVGRAFPVLLVGARRARSRLPGTMAFACWSRTKSSPCSPRATTGRPSSSRIATGWPPLARANSSRWRSRPGRPSSRCRWSAPKRPTSRWPARRTAARLTGLPYFPITTAFPWLGLLGLVPLPTKWYLDFGEPLALDEYGPDAALNLVLVSQLSDRVRHTIQEMLRSRLAQRKSVLLG